MYWQKSLLKEDVSFTTGQDVTVPIPRLFPLSAIEILVDLTATADLVAAAADDMIIEVVKNGHETIDSLTFGELVAINNLMHPMAYQVADYAAVSEGLYACFIPFGRYLKDRDYFLDPRGFNALDLVMTMPTFTGTAATGTYTLIMLRAIDGALTGLGHLELTTKKEYTAKVGIEYTPLDRAYPYALIMVGELDGLSVDLAAVISLIRLNVDAKRIFPIDQNSRDLIIENQVLSGDQNVATLGTPLDRSNCAILNFLKPWLGEDFLFDAPGVGSVVLEVTGLADGTVKVTAGELVK